MDPSTQTLKNQLRQLKDLHQSGALTLAHYQESRAALERRLIDLIVDGTAVAPAPRKPGARLLVALLLAAFVIAIAGYWTTRSPLPNQDSGASDSGTEGPHATDSAQMERMTEQLAARMAEQPGDANGWAMLARSYGVLGKHTEALRAFESAVALRKDDAALLADYADSLAVNNNRSLAGKPMQQVEAALKLNPNHMKALALAGTHAFDRKDYALAAKHWERAVQSSPVGHPMVQSLTAALAEARNLASLPTVSAATNTGATVSGAVTLSQSLAAQAKPDDTVFIFARAVDGSRMPLAMVRTQVRNLPFAFTLDDSSAMSPANALSMVTGKIVVGARVSKSGNATPQSGDLTGQSAPVSVGVKDLSIDIRDVVKR